MSQSPSSEITLPPTTHRWADYAIAAVGLAIAAYFAVVFLRNPAGSEWYHVYVRAALRMRAGETINVVEPVGYAYPPAMAFCTVPLSWPPLWAGMLGWYLLNMAAAAAVFVFAWRLTGGPPLVGLAGRWLAVFALGAVLCLRFVFAPLEHQQFDMVIAGLLMAGCWALARGRDLRAGALLGAAAAMKLTPLLFAPYLVWRRKFAAAAVMLAVVAALNLLPDLLYPQQSGRLYLQDWRANYLAPAAQQSAGTWFADATQNQSLAGLVGRLSTAGPADLSTEQGTADAGRNSKLVVYVLAAVLLAITAWRLGRPLRPPVIVPPDAVPPLPAQQLQVGLESAAGVCLMLLLSPMSSKAHFVVMLLPCFLIARLAIVDRLPSVRWLLIPLAILGPLSTKGFLGKQLGGQALLWSFPAWYVLAALVCVWLGLGWLRRQERGLRLET
jgi:hypothetical protein